MSESLLTVRQVMARTGLKKSSAFELMHRAGVIRPSVGGRSVRVVESWLERLLDIEQGAASRPTKLPTGQHPETSGVYVVQGVGEYVKIGRAENIRRRMREIQTYHPVRIRLFAILSVDPEAEKGFHGRYAEYREHGEWFRIEGILARDLAEIERRRG